MKLSSLFKHTLTCLAKFQNSGSMWSRYDATPYMPFPLSREKGSEKVIGSRKTYFYFACSCHIARNNCFSACQNEYT